MLLSISYTDDYVSLIEIPRDDGGGGGIGRWSGAHFGRDGAGEPCDTLWRPEGVLLEEALSWARDRAPYVHVVYADGSEFSAGRLRMEYTRSGPLTELPPERG